jgi:hypothetical protein
MTVEFGDFPGLRHSVVPWLVHNEARALHFTVPAAAQACIAAHGPWPRQPRCCCHVPQTGDPLQLALYQGELISSNWFNALSYRFPPRRSLPHWSCPHPQFYGPELILFPNEDNSRLRIHPECLARLVQDRDNFDALQWDIYTRPVAPREYLHIGRSYRFSNNPVLQWMDLHGERFLPRPATAPVTPPCYSTVLKMLPGMLSGIILICLLADSTCGFLSTWAWVSGLAMLLLALYPLLLHLEQTCSVSSGLAMQILHSVFPWAWVLGMTLWLMVGVIASSRADMFNGPCALVVYSERCVSTVGAILMGIFLALRFKCAIILRICRPW